MAYLDPMATNQALKKLGSDYQMPDAAAPAPAPAVAAPAPAPAVTVNSVAPVEAPKPAADSTSGLNTATQAAGSVANIVAPETKDNDTMKKVVAGIKGVASLYMGNYAGAAAAASELAG